MIDEGTEKKRRRRPNTSSIAPRGMAGEDVAAYLGLTSAGVMQWVRRGIIPGPISGTHRWDKAAIDAALDKRSGLTQSQPLTAFDEWKRKQNEA